MHAGARQGNPNSRTLTMQTITIRVEGVSPLLMHKFTDEAQLAATAGTRTSSAAIDRGTEWEQARSHLYTADDGETPVIPQPNLASCIMEGGRWHKAGKKQITTAKTSLLPACVFYDAEFYRLEHDGWSVDTRPVRIPSTGGRILRYRPIFHRWSFVFDVSLDTRELSERLFRQIVDDAGNKVGLGDFRPACKGPYGRFKVTSWASQSAMLEAAQ